MYQSDFVPPTDYYDIGITEIDEQICGLLQRRRELSNGNPGFPTMDLIRHWSEKYDLSENYLTALFSSMLSEAHFKPTVEPVNFQKNIPVLKGIDKEQIFYSVSMISQYENASKLYLNSIHQAGQDQEAWQHHDYTYFELTVIGLEETYETRHVGGSGSLESEIHEFIISPALPDDLTAVQFTFTGFNSSFQPTGLSFTL